MLNPIPDVHPLADFQQNPAALLAQLKRTRRPVTLTVNGKPELVLQDADSYQEIVYRADRPEFTAGSSPTGSAALRARRKGSLMERYRALTAKRFESALTSEQEHDLAAMERALEQIEVAEADEIDAANAVGRVAQLDVALDRVEQCLLEWKATGR